MGKTTDIIVVIAAVAGGGVFVAHVGNMPVDTRSHVASTPPLPGSTPPLPGSSPPLPANSSQPVPTGSSQSNPAPPETTIRDAVDDALKSLAFGHIAFSRPQHARVGKTDTVEAKLGLNITADKLAAEISAPGPIEQRDIRVGDRMQATLNGGGAFDVTPSGPQTRWVASNEPTSWTWAVTPKLTGTQVLILSVDALITIKGEKDFYNAETLRTPIEVDVAVPNNSEEWFAYFRKRVEDIGWFWTTLLVPLGAFCVPWWRKWRKGPDSSEVTALSPVDDDISG